MIDIDVKWIASAAFELEPATVVFETDDPEGHRWVDAIAEVNARWYPQCKIVANCATPTGWLGVIYKLPRTKTPRNSPIPQWCERVKERLETAGLSGRLRRPPGPNLRYGWPTLGYTNGNVGLVHWIQDPEAAWDLTNGGWWYRALAPDIAEATVHHSLAMLDLAPDETVVVSPDTRILAADLADYFRAMDRCSGPYYVIRPVGPRPVVTHTVMAYSPGLSEFRIESVGPSSTHLDWIRQAITGAARYSDFACVPNHLTYTRVPLDHWRDIPPGGHLDPRAEFGEIGRRIETIDGSWFQQHIPFVRPLMVLTTTHLERLDDLDGWTVTDLGHERHLLEVHDAVDWIDHPVLVDRFRRELERFTPILLTGDDRMLEQRHQDLPFRYGIVPDDYPDTWTDPPPLVP